MFRRLKNLIVNRILGVADTPERIAFGVFLGFVVAMTPTIGFQIVLYVTIATLIRANKVAGIPILFISNPVSAVPLYWFCWWVGAKILGTADQEVDASSFSAVGEGEAVQWTSIEFWREVGAQMVAMGGELWLGSFVLGIASGTLGYFITLFAVRIYRRARGPRHSRM